MDTVFDVEYGAEFKMAHLALMGELLDVYAIYCFRKLSILQQHHV